jgi:hypothetical protein
MAGFEEEVGLYSSCLEIAKGVLTRVGDVEETI